MCSVVSESKVLIFQLLLQFSILCYKSNVGNKVQFLVVVVIVVEDKFQRRRTNTVKQGILYQTCTGPDVKMIGLVPYT